MASALAASEPSMEGRPDTHATPPTPARWLRPAGALYSWASDRRRRWYARAPDVRQKRLLRPVVSVGNIASGGRGKTPLVRHLAEVLLAAGEVPSILSRGYARARSEDGVVVVRDRDELRADLDRSGDEPLMLARLLDGVTVLVSRDRHLAGRLAESRLGATVHLLDDGFQHLRLARDVDLVVLDETDLGDAVLPAGRLREPVRALARADAVIVPRGRAGALGPVLADLTAAAVFELDARVGIPRMVEPWRSAPRVPREAPVVAAAAIARPERFFDALRESGWNVVETLVWRDHHRFTRHDVDRLTGTARAAQAALVLTTEKDLVRLLPLRPLPLPVAAVPLTVTVEPAEAFRAWLLARVAAAHRARPDAAGPLDN